ncbi:MAG: tetratricopeptide repeat protein [Deltaproteobacteria bacterium]|nr:tetratricopeptide repeat protein [Deltaproteobacteria bacterium]MDQ3298095.1 tetratricopeptide repeat protein [Myxococcota bacterium]
MSRRVLGLVLPLAIALAMAACGGGSATSRIGPQGRQVNRLDPVNPKAQKEFEAALRALRLGGPEAHETAKARFKASLEIDPKLWEAWHDLGVLHYKDGEDEGAIVAFGKALEINKGHTPTLLARAEAHRRANHKKDARGDYEAALRGTDEDDPSRRDAATRLASLLRDAGDYDDAVSVLRETVRVSGVNTRIYTELGLIYIQQQRFELAQLVLAKAIEIDDAEKKDPAIYNALALLALRQGKAQEAFERFDQAASLDATYIDARYNKASVLLDAGDYARAKVELVTIVEKRADDHAAQVALGVAHRGLKEHKDAARTWERVIREAPRRSTPRADAMFNLALLKVDFLEDPAGGKVELDRYLQEAPSSHSRRAAAEEKRKELGK